MQKPKYKTHSLIHHLQKWNIPLDSALSPKFKTGIACCAPVCVCVCACVRV